MNYAVELLRLAQVPQFGAQRIGRLLEQVDFAEFCQYDKTQLRQMGWNEKQIQRWFQPDARWIEPAIAWAEQAGNHLLTLFDPDYPFLLRQISTAPPILSVQGNVQALTLPQIAIVGSRDFSPYGEHWAKYFARELVQQDFAITSGLAIGIDGICHRTVVEQQGITLAVLGSGLAQLYPTRHKSLAEQILASNGALISEFLPNQPPIAENFPRRNRIISGLSLGTLVIEATLNSGSLITARYALEQGREIFALPNSVQNPHSQGCHRLIREGALLVETVEDIISAISCQLPKSLPPQDSLFNEENTALQKLNAPPTLAKISPNLTACQQAILTQMSLEPISIDDLTRACELGVETLLVELLTLELQGAIKQVSGGYVVGS